MCTIVTWLDYSFSWNINCIYKHWIMSSTNIWIPKTTITSSYLHNGIIISVKTAHLYWNDLLTCWWRLKPWHLSSCVLGDLSVLDKFTLKRRIVKSLIGYHPPNLTLFIFLFLLLCRFDIHWKPSMVTMPTLSSLKIEHGYNANFVVTDITRGCQCHK